jgi:hypothetical protein
LFYFAHFLLLLVSFHFRPFINISFSLSLEQFIVVGRELVVFTHERRHFFAGLIEFKLGFVFIPFIFLTLKKDFITIDDI